MQNFEFFIKEPNLRKFVHMLSRYETLSGSIHAISRLGIPAIIQDSPITIAALHQKLLADGIIQNQDSGPLLRLLKYLACYGIFSVSDNTISHTEFSAALTSLPVLTYEIWKKQGNLIDYLATHPTAEKSSEASIILDEEHATLAITSPNAADIMSELSHSHLISRAIYTISELSLADKISEHNFTLETLAQEIGKDKTGLNAFVNLLVRFGFLVIDQATGHIQLTSAAHPLKTGNHEVSIKAAAGMANQSWWNAMGNLDHCVKTGGVPYIHANGVAVFDYLESNPSDRKKFDLGLANSDADQDTTVGSDAVAYEGYKSIVDIGGGNGGLIAFIKSRYPETEATLFEQPGTVRHLENAEHLKACILQPGNFLAATPDETLLPKHKQLYVIKGVLHDFTDEDVVKILKNIRAAMSPLSELKIIDRYIQDDNNRHPNKTGDIQMMAFFAAKERTFEDYQKLAEKAGLALEASSVRQCGNYNIITAKHAALEDKYSMFADLKTQTVTLSASTTTLTQ